LQVWTGA